MEAIAVALGAIGSGVAVLVLALKALSAERRAGEQTTRATAAEINQTSLAAMLVDSTKREEEQRERANKLAAVHAQLLAEMASLPAAGSYQRLLAIMSQAQAAAGGDSSGSMYSPTGAEYRSSTDLLKPGD